MCTLVDHRFSLEVANFKICRNNTGSLRETNKGISPNLRTREHSIEIIILVLLDNIWEKFGYRKLTELENHHPNQRLNKLVAKKLSKQYSYCRMG